VLLKVFGGLAIQQIVVLDDVVAVLANLMWCSLSWIHHLCPLNIRVPVALVSFKGKPEVRRNALVSGFSCAVYFVQLFLAKLEYILVVLNLPEAQAVDH
jgi:hypothetical protein